MADGRTRRSLLATWALGWLGVAAGRVALADDMDDARRFVGELAQNIVTVLRDPSMTENRRLERVGAVTAGAFDLERTARIALGRFWKLASPEQRAEFAGLFRSYVLASYGSRFRDYADRTLRVTGARPADEDVIVESAVEGGATAVRLDWRLARAGHGWLVLDVAVEGVSLLLTYRNEFAAVIERQGGAVAALLDELRRRVAATSRPA